MGDKNTLKQEEILSKGYGIIPKFVMKDKELSAEAKAIYAYLCSYSGAGDTAFPSVELMCNDLKMSRNRFEKHRKDLIDRGYIVISRKRLESGFSNNIYQLPKVLSLQSVPLQNVAVGNVALQNEATNSNSLNINNLNSNSTNKKERSRDSIKYSDEHLMLAQLLQNNLQSDFSREMAKVNIKKWADVIRLMEERDQLTIEQIEYVIKWLPTNSFWFGNIRSASKLREQFSKLVYEIKTEQAKAKQQKKSYGNVRKEQLPEWASNPEQMPQFEEDPAIKAELERRLAEYQRKKVANDGA